MSPKAIKQADDSATGAAQRTVSLTALRNFVVPKVSLTDQQLIVQKLDAISTQTRQLESIYRRKIADLEEMRKSVLQQAFSGEL
jgi:type I restriction enzyme S subunit